MERAKVLNEHLFYDDEFFEDDNDIAAHYYILLCMFDEGWRMKPSFECYVNPQYLF